VPPGWGAAGGASPALPPSSGAQRGRPGPARCTTEHLGAPTEAFFGETSLMVAHTMIFLAVPFLTRIASGPRPRHDVAGQVMTLLVGCSPSWRTMSRRTSNTSRSSRTDRAARVRRATSAVRRSGSPVGGGVGKISRVSPRVLPP